MSSLSIPKLFQQGLDFHKQGDIEQALQFFESVLLKDSEHFDSLNFAAICYLQQNDWDKGYQLLKKAVSLDDSNLQSCRNLLKVCKHLNKADELEPLLKHMLVLKEDDALWYEYGLVLYKNKKIKEAQSAFLKAVESNPNHSQAFFSLGSVVQDEAMAEKYYIKAIDCDAKHFMALNNLATLYKQQGKFAQAKNLFRQAIQLRPDEAELYYNLGEIFLVEGDFVQGWPAYEWRLKKRELKVPSALVPLLKKPFWNHEALDGKTLLVFLEQGIGDEIMFASCLPDLSQKQGRVTLICYDRLTHLFQRAFPNIDVVGYHDDRASAILKQSFDFYCPIGNLPKLFRKDLSAFPQQPAYLKADGNEVSSFVTNYRSLPGKLVVGISWKGGNIEDRIKQRSISLPEWLPILQLPDICFVSVQYGDVRNELNALKENHSVNVFYDASVNALDDMDLFAAQIAACDLILTVDNSTAHLAGALGKPVWILLPFSPDWRWFLDRDEDSPWYPSMRLFRQNARGDWTCVISTVQNALEDLSSSL